MASLNDHESRIRSLESGKANTSHDHPSMSRFTGLSSIGCSGYNVNAIFKAGGHNGVEFVSDVNTFGMGGHQDGNFRFWYGDVTAENSSGKNYIMTLSKTGILSPSKCYNAVWNDYAEFYPKGDTCVEAGDIIMLDINSKEEKYIKAVSGSKTVVGVFSDTFGHIIGGEHPDNGQDCIEYNLDKYIPIGLVGRVNCKIIGKISKGDRVVVSNVDGVGRKYNPNTDDIFQIFGMAVENKETDGIEKIKINFRGGGL